MAYRAASSARRCRARSGERSWRSALASIWRIRSRVTSNSWPISSSVCSRSQPMPKRRRITFSSLGERVFRMLAVSSRTLVSITASTGEPTQRSSIKSPSADSPSRPTGVSSDTGSREMVLSFWTFSTGISIRREISSLVGARPSSFSSSRVARRNLFIDSFMWTGIRMVRDWSAMARVIAWRIHQLAQVGLEVRHLFGHPLDVFRKLFPLRNVERNLADRLGYFHTATGELAHPLAPQLLVAERDAIQLVPGLGQLLVLHYDLGQIVLNPVDTARIGRAFLFEVDAQVDKSAQIFGFVLDLLGDLDGPQLHDRRPADRLLHAQLAPLHLAGQVYFAFAGQQRNGAHFA